MKKFLAVKILYFIALSCFSQDSIDFRNYSPLICKGTIPRDFKIELSRLVEQEKKSQSGKSQKDKDQAVTFSEISNYQLNNILFSGKVLYGDVLTNYVNKVADIILESDKDLRGEVRFYVLRNTDLNAYSTQRGIIFISIGLLAQIESEAQLAFIMCHEIVHYKNSHNLETYKKRQQIFSTGNDITSSSKISNILNYSKENELEADREGLDFFLKTPYGTGELNNLFDVMLYSYLPFDEIGFDTMYFNSGNDYVLPRQYFLSQVADITAEEDVVDSMSTHPNIRKRREMIQSLLKTKSKKTGVSFINPESEFFKIQRIARHELAIAYLQDSELELALYSGYLIEKNYGKSLFSDKIIAGALYAKSKQKNNSNYSDNNVKTYISDDDEDDEGEWKKVEGESQSVFHFLYKIPGKELSILASRKMHEGYNLYKDPFFADRFGSVIYDLVNTFDMEKSDFLSVVKVKTDTDSSVLKEESEDTQGLSSKPSKISKIKKNKASQSDKKVRPKDAKYYAYAFAEFYHDSLLNASFANKVGQKLAEEKKTESWEYRKYIAAKNKIIRKYGQGLNIDKLILINPFFSSYISKKYYNSNGYLMSYRVNNPEVSPLEELQIEQNLLKYVLEYAGKTDLNISIIGSTQQASIETDKFNDFQQLITWLSERIALGKMGTYTYMDQYMAPYVEEYGHLGFCHVVKNNRSLEMVFVLFNIETGGSEFIYERKFRKGKPDGVLVKMMLYDIMHQIKQDAHRIDRLKKWYKINE